MGRLNLQTLINTYPDSEYLAKAKLSIAASYYKEGGSANLTQAIAGYKDFIVFFPFLPEAPYAQIQVAMTHYKQMEKPDRDRSEAKAAEEEFRRSWRNIERPAVSKAEQHLRRSGSACRRRLSYRLLLLRKGRSTGVGRRLLSVTKRYPYYSKSDQALWMLGDISKKRKKEIASVYYSRIVRTIRLPLWWGCEGKSRRFMCRCRNLTRRRWPGCKRAAPRPGIVRQQADGAGA